MPQMNRAGLRNVRTRLQSDIDTSIVQNTTGLITGTVMNTILDSISTVIEDVIDSADILSSAVLAPSIRTFLIQNQSTSVAEDTVLTGSKTFEFTVTEPANVDGNLTLKQAGAILRNDIDPNDTSAVATINDITLSAGQSVTFTLEGTATVGAGGAAFSRDFVVTARQATDYMYWGLDADGDPSNFNVATAQQAVWSQSQTITLPSFADVQHIVIAQRATDPDITEINIGGINQIGAFTKTANAFLVGATQYDAWTSNNPMLGTVVSGESIQVVR